MTGQTRRTLVIKFWWGHFVNMNTKEFLIRLNSINEKSAIKALISEYIDAHADKSPKEEIKNYIYGLPENQFTSFGNKLGYCRNYCIEENKNEENKDETQYLTKVSEVLKKLVIISEVYQEINIQREEDKKQPNEVAAISQQKDVLREINNKIIKFRTEIDAAKREIENTNSSFNDKVFSLLINTVAILGIFVTIAFAGFGVTSIFSNINFTQACVSYENLVKAVFFLVLTTLLSYNLLLLLIYFVFKLSRPLITGSKKDKEGKEFYETFSKAINLTPFLWIDGILLFLSIVFFIWCLFL